MVQCQKVKIYVAYYLKKINFRVDLFLADVNSVIFGWLWYFYFRGWWHDILIILRESIVAINKINNVYVFYNKKVMGGGGEKSFSKITEDVPTESL